MSLEQAHEQNDNLDLESLSFSDLQRRYQQALEFGAKTFQQQENGFKNILGQGVFISSDNGRYKVSEISKELTQFQLLVVREPDSIIVKGSKDKTTLMAAIKTKLEEFGYRIIN